MGHTDSHSLLTVPSGASTGTREAHERRDGEGSFDGRSVRDAIDAIDTELAPAIRGRDIREQRTLDETLAEVGGTAHLERVGADAVLGVSGAALSAAAAVEDQPLYQYLAATHAGGDANAPDADGKRPERWTAYGRGLRNTGHPSVVRSTASDSMKPHTPTGTQSSW